MKSLVSVVLILLLHTVSIAQKSPAIVDSMKRQLARVTTYKDKVEILGILSMTLMNTSIPESDKYGALMSREAELSRSRELMVKAFYNNGLRYSYFGQNREFLQKAIDYFNRGLAMAKENKLEKDVATGYLYLSSVYTRVPDLDKSLGYATQAFSVVQLVKDDSLTAATHLAYGKVYQAKKERLLALRYLLNALSIAEEKKDHDLLHSCYVDLSSFYADIKEYDKAIDYTKLAIDELPHTDMDNSSYQNVVLLYNLGNLYVAKKNFDMSVYYFEESIRMADSIDYKPLKMPGYNGLLVQYITAKQPEKALEFFNNRADLKQFINNFGFGHAIDDAYGVIYTQLGKYDSADYYFQKAMPGFEAKSTPQSRLYFYAHYGDFFDKSGNPQQAIAYFSKAMDMANQMANLEWQQNVAKELDSLYAKTGDYKQSYYYNGLYAKYKDSLLKLGEQKDLLQMELADEQQRQERKKREAEIALRERHNIQYMGITIAIALVFLMLVLMGAFKVSETTIKVMGFFAFILLFEFIILIADGKIHHWTHGEPLPILGIKIILIAILLPLHHWLEHKVVSYLASRRLILPKTKSFWNNLKIKKSRTSSVLHDES